MFGIDPIYYFEIPDYLQDSELMDLEFKKELEEVMGYLEKLPAKGAEPQSQSLYLIIALVVHHMS